MMIEINGLKKKFGNFEALKGINLKVNKGEIYGFIGHNGAGKTTTMNILAGISDFDEGSCIVGGQRISSSVKKPVQNLGYLPEEPSFYPYMTSFEYLNFVGRFVGDSSANIKKKTEQLLKLVKLENHKRKKIGGYSKGMKQRFGLAVALYKEPDILILDEPSSALDPEGRRDMVDIIKKLKKEGKTIFLSTHILSDIEKICDRVGMIKHGMVIIEESLDALMKKYILPIYKIELGSKNYVDRFDSFKDKDYVEKIEINEDEISIYLKNEYENKVNILSELAPLNEGIVSVSIKKSSLEDIYSKVVKENE